MYILEVIWKLNFLFTFWSGCRYERKQSFSSQFPVGYNSNGEGIAGKPPSWKKRPLAATVGRSHLWLQVDRCVSRVLSAAGLVVP